MREWYEEWPPPTANDVAAIRAEQRRRLYGEGTVRHEEAMAFISATAKATPFRTPHGINELPYVLWPAVAAMMDAYKAGLCPPGTHKWTGQRTGGPSDPDEWVEFCDVCGVENGGSGELL